MPSNPLDITQSDEFKRFTKSIAASAPARKKVSTISPPPERTYEPDEIRAYLRDRLIGQDAAITQVCEYLDIYFAGLAEGEGRPAGIFLLTGGTGSGKTYLAELIAGFLHGDSSKLLKIDCGEFQLEHEVSKLVSSPPGYLGHRETPPLLGEKALTAARSDDSKLAVLLFDEIEKASPVVHRILLGIFDKGKLTVGDNSSVVFKDTVIFLTSNLGAKELARETTDGPGFNPRAGATAKRLSSITDVAVRRKFSPEFLNRLDAVIPFAPLTEGDFDRILNLEIAKIQVRLAVAGVELVLTPRAVSELRLRGLQPRYGAREIKRVLRREVLKLVAGEKLQGSNDVTVDFDGKFVVS